MRKLLTPLLGLALLLTTIWIVGVAAAASQQIKASFAPFTPVVGFDFEDGTVQGWEVNTNTLTTTTGVQNTTSQHYSGTHSLQVNVHDTAATTYTLSAIDVPSITTGNIITAHVQVRGTFVITSYAAMAAIDANGNYHLGVPVGVPTNQWTTINLIFTDTVPMPLQQLGVGVAMGHLPFSFSANYYVDDVEWDTVTFPTATPTALPATDTPAPPATDTATPQPPTATATNAPPTDTPAPTDTPGGPTSTPAPPTSTPLPSNTPGGPTDTPAPATETPLPSVTPTDCPNPFVDISGNIFYGAIHYLNCRGVINGTDSTHYSPAGTSTRGQFAKVVVLGFGLPLSTPATPTFSDVPTTYFAYAYIETGYANQILSGFDQASCQQHGAVYPCYLPNLAITRGQLTKLVVGAAHYPYYTPSTGQTFTDVPPTNVFYVSIETAANKGVVSGYADHTFRPNNNIRRDEMAQIVFKGVTTP